MSFTTQSKKSGAITFNLIILVVFLIGLVGRVSAHGVLLAPPLRLVNSEDKIMQANNPTMIMPCGAGTDGHGPTTKYMPGEQMLVAYNVTITHMGDCLIQMSMHGDKDFKTLKNLGTCGMKTGVTSDFVELPHEECEACTIRFMWVDQLGNNYLNCANIQIAKPMMHKRKRSLRRSLRF